MIFIQRKDKPDGKYHIFESITTLCNMNYSDMTDYVMIDPKKSNGYLCKLCKINSRSTYKLKWRIEK
jgi:hypothetical protein